jgi:hypothetical protein
MAWNDKELAREVLEEFCEAGDEYMVRVNAMEAKRAEWIAAERRAAEKEREWNRAADAAYLDQRRATDRERKRANRETMAAVRKLEGLELRVCPTCGAMFEWDHTTPGRPQVHCCHGCAVVAAMRSYRKRLVDWTVGVVFGGRRW